MVDLVLFQLLLLDLSPNLLATKLFFALHYHLLDFVSKMPYKDIGILFIQLTHFLEFLGIIDYFNLGTPLLHQLHENWVWLLEND